MPPTVRCTRTVRVAGAQRGSRERLRLLTYKMALAQPHATVPLLSQQQHTRDGTAHTSLTALSAQQPRDSRATAIDGGDGGGGGAQDARALAQPRRWVRDADELCVASIRRSTNINHINSYIATYKLDHPHWRDLLLPEVTVLPRATVNSSNSNNEEDKRSGGGSDDNDGDTHGATAVAGGAAPPRAALPADAHAGDAYDVYIDYNKQTTLELMSRHVNYALRHIVQKGHALYLITCAQHSVVQMRGLVEASYVTCAYGVLGERLRTYITHVGPLDARDVLTIDRRTRAVHFDLTRPHVRRGVVALSQVEGYGTWFERRTMLWQRTRRVGALQAQMGAFAYNLAAPPDVGRVRAYEVALLAPHVRSYSNSGADAVAVIASSQVAQNARLYMGAFEAPAMAAVDAVQQLAHYTALQYKLLHAAPSATATEGNSDAEQQHSRAHTTATADDDVDVHELRRRLSMERLLPVSWLTRTPRPYVPLEADLPFRIQLSRPAVIGRTQHSAKRRKKAKASTHTDTMTADNNNNNKNNNNKNDDEENEDEEEERVLYPTSGTVGSPFIGGVPVLMYEYHIHQGVDHYIFDDAPSARPTRWWSQKSTMPYNGYLYCMRSGLLDDVRVAEHVPNPLAAATTHTADDAAAAATTTQASATRQGQRRRLSVRRQAQLQRRLALRRRAALARRRATTTTAAADATTQSSAGGDEDKQDATAPPPRADDDSSRGVCHEHEVWTSATGELRGHDAATRAQRAREDDSEAAIDVNDSKRAREVLLRANEQRRPTHQLLPPSAVAARRHAQMRAAVMATRRSDDTGSGSSSNSRNDHDDDDKHKRATRATMASDKRHASAAALLRARIAARRASDKQQQQQHDTSDGRDRLRRLDDALRELRRQPWQNSSSYCSDDDVQRRARALAVVRSHAQDVHAAKPGSDVDEQSNSHNNSSDDLRLLHDYLHDALPSHTPTASCHSSSNNSVSDGAASLTTLLRAVYDPTTSMQHIYKALPRTTNTTTAATGVVATTGAQPPPQRARQTSNKGSSVSTRHVTAAQTSCEGTAVLASSVHAYARAMQHRVAQQQRQAQQRSCAATAAAAAVRDNGSSATTTPCVSCTTQTQSSSSPSAAALHTRIVQPVTLHFCSACHGAITVHMTTDNAGNDDSNKDNNKGDDNGAAVFITHAHVTARDADVDTAASTSAVTASHTSRGTVTCTAQTQDTRTLPLLPSCCPHCGANVTSSPPQPQMTTSSSSPHVHTAVTTASTTTTSSSSLHDAAALAARWRASLAGLCYLTLYDAADVSS